MAEALTKDELKQARVLASIARDVYNPAYSVTESWQKLSDKEIDALGISADFLNETLSGQIAKEDGLRAGLYRTADNELVLAFAGTNLKSTRDWITNLRQGIGLETDEYTKAAALARQFQAAPGKKYLTGHSKGGALASLAAIITQNKAVTFNPAGLHPETLERESISHDAVKNGAGPELIVNIAVEDEILQKVNGLPLTPDPIGEVFSISGETIADMNSFDRHLMHAVIETIDDELFTRDFDAVKERSELKLKSADGKLAQRPTVFLIAGPNGAGKSTLYKSIIGPKISAPFINADIIQKEELRDPSMAASYTARDMAIERREAFLKDGKSFVFETVFSHESKLKEVTKYKEAGFNVVLYHVGLKSADISVDRVQQRVEKGGHNVPEQKIRDRFERNQPLIRQAALLADRAFIYDNSVDGKAIKLGVEFEKGKVVSIGENLQKWQRDLYDKDLRPFSSMRQNPAAASYDVISRMAEEVVGGPVQVKIPKAGYKYTGPLVGESAMHYLQKTQYDYVGHFKSAVGEKQKLGSPVEVSYTTNRRASVKAIEPLSADRTVAETKESKSKQNELDKLPKLSKVSTVLAKSLLIKHGPAAKREFEEELLNAKNGNDKAGTEKALSSKKALKVGPPLIDSLRVGGVRDLKLQGPTDTPARLVNTILKSAFTEYQARGLGKDVHKRSVDRNR